MEVSRYDKSMHSSFSNNFLPKFFTKAVRLGKEKLASAEEVSSHASAFIKYLDETTKPLS